MTVVGRRMPDAGLCARCIHARTITSGKGSTFVLCGVSARDPRFPKYPALPVVRCTAFSAVAPSDQGSQR